MPEVLLCISLIRQALKYLEITFCLYIPTLSLQIIVYECITQCIDVPAIHRLYIDNSVSPLKSPKLSSKHALLKNLNAIVSLDVSHVETFCFSNRNNLFPLMKQFVSIKETNKEHIVFQIVIYTNPL